ncbi:MAG: DNA repair protein RecN [Lysobacteraceae bacterium]
MLRRVYLKDFAVISEAEIGFTTGMTVISGETGAGKSLLVDALLFISGARADSGVVRHGADRAELLAEFGLDDAPAAADWLREQELDEDGELALRRVIRADGGSRAWINGRPATLGQLAELGGLLIEIHGQHEHQALLQREHQRELLDAFGRYPEQRQAVADLAADWRGVQRELERLDAADDSSDRLAYLEHQLAELARESLEPEAIESLIADQRRQGSAADLIEASDRAAQLLSGDDGFAIASQIGRVRAELGKLANVEPRLAEIDATLETAAIAIDEAASGIDQLRDDFDLDPERLQELEQTLGRLNDLARKHRVSVERLGERRGEIATEVEELRGRDEAAERLRRQRSEIETRWRDAAKALTAKRQKAAAQLGKDVSALMDQLGMGGGRLEATLEPREDASPHPNGAERIELLVAANPGQPPRPLRKVASGGELSRISLAIEVAALGLDSIPSMVFDEVDSGIGGAVAAVVGRKLRELAASRQVLCVTHLPQVASQAHQHYRVSKGVDGGITRSAIARLDNESRIEELARMLGGLGISAETTAHARQMLTDGQRD